MGESAQETAARSQRDDLARLQDRLLGGDLSGSSMFGQIGPYFERAQGMITSGIPGIEAAINSLFGARSAGISQDIGESLVTSGVARGHDTGSAFTAAMSPAIAANMGAIADLRKFGISSIADLEKLKGLTLADLLQFSTQAGLQAQGLENQAIGGMKKSTTFGDIMSVVTMLANVGKALAGMGLFSAGAGAAGAGATDIGSSDPGFGTELYG